LFSATPAIRAARFLVIRTWHNETRRLWDVHPQGNNGAKIVDGIKSIMAVKVTGPLCGISVAYGAADVTERVKQMSKSGPLMHYDSIVVNIARSPLRHWLV